MKINRPKNTKEKGFFEVFFYKEGDRYIGVNLTFDIVEEGKDPVLLMKSIEEASILHLECVIKENLPDSLLNRYAPEKYWLKFFEALEKRVEKKSEKIANTSFFQQSPYQRTLAVNVA